MALNSSYEMASAFGQAVDVVAAMPDLSFSHISVHADDERPFVVLRLSPTIPDADKTRTRALTLVDGWEVEERHGTAAMLPDGTSVRIDEEGLLRFPERRLRGRSLLPERSRNALYQVHHFAGSLAVSVYCLGATLWPSSRNPEGRQGRVSSDVEVMFSSSAEQAKLLEIVGRTQVLSYESMPAKPGRPPKEKWELELPSGGQSMTLFAVDRSPSGTAAERAAAKISRND